MKIAVAALVLAACRPVDPIVAAPDAVPDPAENTSLFAQSQSFPPRNQVLGSASSSVVVTMDALTTIGDLLVVGVELDSSAQVIAVSDNAPESARFTDVTAAHAVDDAAGNGLELWYAPITRAPATEVSIEATGLIHAAVVWEFVTTGVMAIDASAASSDQPMAAHPASPPVMATTAGEIVVVATASSAHVVGNSAAQGFAEDGTANYDGWAHASGFGFAPGLYSEEWDTPPTGTYCASAVSFAVSP